MKYAIARYYVNDCSVYECLDGTLYYLPCDWEYFFPNIAEPTDALEQLFGKQLLQVDLLKKLQSQLELRLPNISMRVVSACGQDIYLAADFPFSKIHKLSFKEFETLTPEHAFSLLCENEPRTPIQLRPISAEEYPTFLEFIVTFKNFYSDHILTLYATSPRLTNVKTIGEWLKLGYTIPSSSVQSAILLSISVSQSFFKRGNTSYPVEYALQSERSAIAVGKLPLTQTELSSCLLVLDSQNVTGESSTYSRQCCDANLFFHAISKLASTQGIQIRTDNKYTDSFYQNTTIHLPAANDDVRLAKMICREYAAAFCDKTVAVTDTLIKDLYSDSLAYLLAYRYGLEEQQTVHLSKLWNEIGMNIDISALTKFLHHSLLHIENRIDPKLFTVRDQLHTLEQNFLQGIPSDASTVNRNKFKNLSGGKI